MMVGMRLDKNIPALPITLFSRHRTAHGVEFTAELSDLTGLDAGRFRPLYDDSADRGIVVEGKTGARVTYAYSHEEFTGPGREGELVAIVLGPTTESIREVPACANTRIRLFND